jgi:AcrR family transcriptional regulator
MKCCGWCRIYLAPAPQSDWNDALGVSNKSRKYHPITVLSANLYTVKIEGLRFMQSRSYHHGDLKNALIEAGLKTLAESGANGLSLRRVAELAGVSHSAPYAHFKDKEELIAAIATTGFHRLHERLDAAANKISGEPSQQIVQAAWAYLDFAIEQTELFRLMFSRMLSNTTPYAELDEVTRRLFQSVVQVASQCGSAQKKSDQSAELTALIIWGQVHGIVQLALENQIASSLLDAYSVKEILRRAVKEHVN